MSRESSAINLGKYELYADSSSDSHTPRSTSLGESCFGLIAICCTGWCGIACVIIDLVCTVAIIVGCIVAGIYIYNAYLAPELETQAAKIITDAVGVLTFSDLFAGFTTFTTFDPSQIPDTLA